jgi:hypothetical protein
MAVGPPGLVAVLAGTRHCQEAVQVAESPSGGCRMIWFAIAVVLIVAGAVMIWLSRSGSGGSAPVQEEPENLFER